jgi:hypothetical protein
MKTQNSHPRSRFHQPRFVLKQLLVLFAFVVTCAAFTQSESFQLRFDSSFAQKSMLTLDTAQERLLIVDLQTLPNGGIVVLAHPRDWNRPSLVMKQFLANGKPDAKFGSKGVLRLNGAAAFSMARYENGDWLILREDNLLQRLSSTGKPVLQFGKKGLLRIPTPKGYEFESAFVNTENSSITLAGTYTAPPSDRYMRPALASARLTAAGKLDSSYGFGGVNRTALDMVGGFREARRTGSGISVFGNRPPGTTFGAFQIHEAGFDERGDLEVVRYLTSDFYGAAMTMATGSPYGLVFASNFDFESTSSFIVGGESLDTQRLQTEQWPAMSELRSEDSGDVVFRVHSLIYVEQSMLVFGRIKGREKPVILRLTFENIGAGIMEWKPDVAFGKGGAFEFPVTGGVTLTRDFEGGAYVATISKDGPLNLWRLRF